MTKDSTPRAAICEETFCAFFVTVQELLFHDGSIGSDASQVVPEQQRRDPAPRTGNRVVARTDIFNLFGNPVGIFFSHNHETAWDRQAAGLVAAAGNRVDYLMEVKIRTDLGVDQGERDPEKCSIAVDRVVSLSGIVKNVEDSGDVVDRAEHGGADVGNHDRFTPRIATELVGQGRVVDLPLFGGSNRGIWDFEEPGILFDAVVALIAEVDFGARIFFSCQIHAVQIAFAATPVT